MHSDVYQSERETEDEMWKGEMREKEEKEEKQSEQCITSLSPLQNQL